MKRTSSAVPTSRSIFEWSSKLESCKRILSVGIVGSTAALHHLRPRTFVSKAVTEKQVPLRVIVSALFIAVVTTPNTG